MVQIVFLLISVAKTKFSSLLIAVIEAEPVASKYDECIEVIPSNEQIESTEHSSGLNANLILFENDHLILHIPVDSIIEKLSEESDDISCAEQNHSDVVPGVYEGEYLNRFLPNNLITVLII